MINLFPLRDETTGPEAARDALAATKRNFGMIPNLERVMANAPALLAAYSAAWDLFDTTSLTPIERQVVYQTANMRAVAYLPRQAGKDVEALRIGARLSDPKLEALRTFARRSTERI